MNKSFIILCCLYMAACNSASTDETQATATQTENSSTANPDSISVPAMQPMPADTLHHFWALDSLDGKVIVTNDFPFGTPYMELNMEKKTLSGHSGCNSMKGTFEAKGNKILFGKISSEENECKIKKFARNYLNALSGKEIEYEFHNRKLILKTGAASSHVYRIIQ